MYVLTKDQIMIFLTTIYGGIIIGFMYDLYRVFRYFLKPKKIATIIEDLSFWIMISIIAIGILFYSNWGQLRGYVFIGFVIGVLLYFVILSKLIIKILIKIIRVILKPIKIMIGYLVVPFKYLKVVHRKLKIKVVSKIRCRVKIRTKKYKRCFKRILSMPHRIVYDIKKYGKYIFTKK